jgi:2-polyprenyl-6-methoxyphenol hydroxylase-like FAD-dependent oxidoreductase
MPAVRTAAVIGGGIAGPVLALALRRAGIEATVYEDYPTTADGLGGTLALAPNGVAALDIVGCADPIAAVAHAGHRQVMSVGGRRIELPALGDVGPLHVIRRADLYRVLQDRLAAEGVRVEHGKRLVTAREDADGVVAVFADGSEGRADVLAGADGVHSTVRTLIDPSAPGPKYTGMLAFEGVSDIAVPEEPGTMTFAFGRRAYYLYTPDPGGGTSFGVNLPYPRPLSIREARAIPAGQWLSTLRDVYGDDNPGGALMRHIQPAALQVSGALFIMPPVPHWHRGRMVLVGDAVHAPSNSSGQGASLAVESAVELARCLRDMPSVPAAFAAYETQRRSRVEGVAAQAAKINHTKTPGRLGQAILPFVMPLLLKLVMKPEKTIGPIQRYRIDWATPPAS